MIAPLAPALPPVGAMAHCDAPVFPEPEISQQLRAGYGTIATGGCPSGGGIPACPPERQNYHQMISPENVPLQELLMGVETPIPQKMITTAAPKGRPRGGSRRLK